MGASLQPASSAAAKLPGAPVALRINGDPSPVGVDPDDVSFAWQVADPRRGAVQSAYRLDGVACRLTAGDGLGLGRGGLGPPGVRRLHRTRAGIRHRIPLQLSRPAMRTGSGARSLGPHHFVTGLRQRDWTAQWLRPGPAGHGSREVHLPANRPSTFPRACRRMPSLYTAGRPQVPALAERPEARHGTELLLPRRAVRAGDRRERGGVSRGRGTRSGSCTTGTARAREGRRRLPAFWPSFRSDTPTEGASWSAPTEHGGSEQPSGCLLRSATPTPVTSSRSSTRARARQDGPTADYDDSDWRRRSGDGTGRHRSFHPPLRPADPHHRAPRATGLCDDARRRSGRGRLREDLRGAARSWSSTRESRGAPISMHVGYVLDPDGHVSTTHATQADQPRLLSTSSATARRPSSPTPTWASDISRSTIPVRRSGDGQVTRDGAPLHDARRSKKRTFSSSDPGLDAVWDLCARSAPLHDPRAVRRHADAREGPVPVGLVQRVAGHHEVSTQRAT